MTDQSPYDTTPPGGEPLADEPLPEGGTTSSTGDSGASPRAQEWLSQLQTMIQDVATQAAPVARQVAAKAAELTAVAAVKAGPFAHRAAEVTNDAGQKLAERAQGLASELRGETPSTPVEDVPWTGAASTSADPAADFATDSPVQTPAGDEGQTTPGG
jgi:hypothetical protein